MPIVTLLFNPSIRWYREIERAGLPVSHETIRSGSPLTLVLTKQRTVFGDAQARRKRDAAALKALRKLGRVFDEGR